MRYMMFTDVHMDARYNESTSAAEDSLACIKEMVQFARDNGIKKAICLGDMLNWKTQISTADTPILNEAFSELAYFTDFYVEPGNHDLYDLTKGENLISIFQKLCPSMKVMEDYTIVEESKTVALHFAPFNVNIQMTKEFIESKIDKTRKTNLLFCHIDCPEYYKDSSRATNKVLVDPAALTSFTKVYSGHLHQRLTKGNINFIGAMRQVRQQDEGNVEGFWTLDTSTLKETFHKFTKAKPRKFVTLEVSEKADIASIKSLKNKVVRVHITASKLNNAKTKQAIIMAIEKAGGLFSTWKLPKQTIKMVDDMPEVESERDMYYYADVYMDTEKPPSSKEEMLAFLHEVERTA